MRICSFLPSATEILYSLGLGEDLCGVSDECDFPVEVKNKPVVVRSLLEPSALAQGEIDGRVIESLSHGHAIYSIDSKLLAKLRPDVVVTQDLCEVCSVSLKETLKTVSDLSKSCEVVSLKPRGLDGVLEDVVTVGRACGAESRAVEVVGELRGRIDRVREEVGGLDASRVFCAEWYDPIFASGHWVPEMVRIAGGEDALGKERGESRKIDWKRVLDYDPEVLVLIPCGFGVERAVADLGLLTKLEGWAGLSSVRSGKVFAADGSSYFSRPGPRLVDGLELIAKILHPEHFGRDLPSDRALRVPRSLLAAKM